MVGCAIVALFMTSIQLPAITFVQASLARAAQRTIVACRSDLLRRRLPLRSQHKQHEKQQDQQQRNNILYFICTHRDLCPP